MSLPFSIQYSDYFKLWHNDTSTNESSTTEELRSIPAINQTYEIYAPNFPYPFSPEEQNYIEQLSERWKNRSNYTLFNVSAVECNHGHWAGLYFEFISYFLYVLIFVTAVIGNSIVLFIVQSHPRMRTVTNYFITNLAVGDLLMMLFCVPFTFISMFVLQYWPFGLIMCRLVNYTQAVSVLVSAYTLVAISGDRYLAIMWPLKPRITKTCSKVLIGVVWIIALITAAPTAIFSTLILPTEWHAACNLPICKEMWPSKEQESYYSTTLLMTQFVIPLLVLIYTYTRIAIVVWGKRPPGEAENSRDQRMARSKRKMIKMMVTVVIVFTICWLPFNSLMVVDVDTSWNLLPYVWFAFHWLAMSHSCYNPIIYCYMNARFRSGFILVLHGVPGLQQLCCCFRHTPINLARNVGSSVALAGEMNGIYGDSALSRKARKRESMKYRICIELTHAPPT
ncbi:RYamide receptor-like isoform X2 [Toxorhynchites rutilus septentrionalis]|uniref:RYamide receptor-like isoform X2 n=1 Tax=Toxorhynchites rutilus septentrionalis TaxID=329112 RepID=UPI00247B0AEB|nr:RYamide receptor-like isoform X2 [Toxorhynchites rutilus septentrionalis]